MVLDLDLCPRTITLSTFTTLLTQYDSTVQRIRAKKAPAGSNSKSKSNFKKPTKGGKGPKKTQEKNRKRAADSAANENEDENASNDSHNQNLDIQNQVAVQVRQFQDLDDWRYGVLPEILKARRNGVEGEEEGRQGAGYLSKEEAIKLMEWKLKHGVNRPTLLGLIKSNREQVIRDATSRALAYLSSSLPSIKVQNTDEDEDEDEEDEEENEEKAEKKDPAKMAQDEFYVLQKTLEKLTVPIRGVGPATASLILSIAEPERVPFYSDDIYLWLCVGIYPEPAAAELDAVEKGDDEKEGVGVEDEDEEEARREEEKLLKSKRPRKDKTNGGKKAMSRKDGEKPSKEVRPNGELNVKYNLPEYRRLWDAVRRLRERLNTEGRAQGVAEVSCVDVEKVALVVRHFEIGTAVDAGERPAEKKEEEEEHEGTRKKRKMDQG